MFPKNLPPLSFDATAADQELCLHLYRHLLRPRMIEEKMLVALRQGRISKWFSSYGQEAVSVGTALAMQPDETILTMHRNLGVFTAREVPLFRLFSQFQGKLTGFTKGRDRSFHFGSKEHHLVGMISHLGPQLGVADGIALSHKLKKEKKATLVFTGDGGASEGDFHEALNVASVWGLPVLFVVENNQWGLSTPSREQFNFDSFLVKGPAYGMEAHSIDGNNILDVYRKAKELTESMRENPRPVLLECKTFRVRGHEEASGTKYYPEGLIDAWSERDPVDAFGAFLEKKKWLSAKERETWKQEEKEAIQQALEDALLEPEPVWDEAAERADLFAPSPASVTPAPNASSKEMRLIDAISEGLRESMRRHPELVLMGQDIGAYGGVFKVTDGFVNEFGAERVRNTPLCEAAILGAGLGLSVRGMKAMVEMQFSDFVTEGFTQIVNNLAKIHWRWGQQADVVVRMPTGAGVAAGPFHSQSTEAWFAHTPGLKVVYPAFPADAKGLLCAAFDDPNPVLFFEHKALYRSLSQSVPEGYYSLPLGEAAVLREGCQATVITYGMGVHWALEVANKRPEWDLEIIDLRTIQPLDWKTLEKSAQKTGRVLVLQEDVLFGGVASDIAAHINERCFEFLDAPVVRVASADTPIPFAASLEKGFLASYKFENSLEKLIAF
jgi:2-oxoisovalerate dehydrogenase E1 component